MSITTGVTDAMSSFSDDDDALMTLLLEEEGLAPDEPGSGTILRRGSARAPLSDQQRSVWFMHEMDPASAAYNISAAFALCGDLDVQALVGAFGRVVERHEVLRTSFGRVSGQIWQHVAETLDLPVFVDDWSDRPDDSAALASLCRSEAEHAFDLARPPLWRARLVRLAASRHALTLTVHHIVADAVSVDLWLTELARFYEIERGRSNVAPEPLSVQYCDYAQWQQQAMTRARFGRQATYWTTRLSGMPALDLPTDRPRPRQPSFRGGLVTVDLDQPLTEALSALARGCRATPYIVLLAAFAALMQRYSRQTDFGIGTSFANRNQPGLDELIGFFAKMLVIRCDLAEAPSFRELVGRVRDAVLEAIEHADLPLDALVERLQPERETSRHPLFGVALTVFRAGAEPPALGGLELTPLGSQNASRFDLELFFRESPSGYGGVISYNTDLFDAEMIGGMRDALRHFLREACRDPERAVTHIPVVPADAPAALIPARARFPATESLHGWFDRVAAENDWRTALRLGGAELSYGELRAWSDGVACALVEAGVIPGQFVGLCCVRGFPLIAGLIGILKAGAAYVPLDPAYPAERLRFVADDVAIGALLTDGSPVPSTLAERRRVIDVAECRFLPPAAPVFVSPAAAAYVIHTSGSTGEPKGVLVSHSNVVRLLMATADVFDVGPQDVWTLFHSYAFDFSVWEMWGALLHGGSVVIVPQDTACDADAFYALVCDGGVTVLSQTPGAFKRLSAAEGRSAREHDIRLRYVIFGGEALEAHSLLPWFDRHGDEMPQLINMYGITETTVHVTSRRVGLRDAVGRRGSLIGRPISDLSLRLVNEALLPVPSGAVGEIVVGGPGVSLGYLNRPDLTAERFIPDDPADPASRLYRSGDLGRRLSDGDIEYRGRLDTQVKIRGFRIEPAEIGGVITAHSAVADAAVVADGEGDDRRLIAYVIPAAEALAADGSAAESAVQVKSWKQTFDTVYAGESVDLERPDFSGWVSSYTGKPIAESDMRVWLRETLERLRALAPRRVLEVGCGTGMIMAGLATELDAYTGLDLSERVVERLRRAVTERGWGHVRLESGDALSALTRLTDGNTGGPYDLVVINSVAQYFPSAEYLESLLYRLAPSVAPGGTIFLGDMRAAASLRLFHCSIQAFGAGPSIEAEALRSGIDRAVQQEAELLVDPGYLAALPLPRLGWVKSMLKDAGTDTEMTKFRYDALLHLDKPLPLLEATDIRDISADTVGGEPALEALLAAYPDRAVIVTGALNARLAPDLARLVRVDDQSQPGGTVFDPARLANVAARLSRPFAAGFTPGSRTGRFDAAFGAAGADATPVLPIWTPAGLSVETSVSRPLDNRRRTELVREIRKHVAARLPPYMVPADVVLLNVLPLTQTGKLDMAALPAPGRDWIESQSEFIAPSTPLEIAAATLFAEVLGLSRVGARDNFFERGGHSLLATQFAARLRDKLAIDIPLRLVFENPVLADLAAALEERVFVGLPDGSAKIGPRPVELAVRAPVSLGQGRLLFLHGLLPDSSIYNIQVALRLTGSVDAAHLEGAVSDLVARHEILRTRYEQGDGTPVQVIDPLVKIDFALVDLTRSGFNQALAEARCAMTREAGTAFDLQKGPVLRSRLYRLAPDESVFCSTLHHIAGDGWSFRVMVAELEEFYAARLVQRKAALPAEVLQYADFAAWQCAAEDRFRVGLEYWKQRLAGIPTAIRLPVDRPRPARPSFRGTSVWFRLPGRSLRATAQAEGITPFMLFLAALSLVLAEAGGDDDIIIGTPIANRTRPELEAVVGFFVNTIALRMASGAAVTGRDLLQQAKNVALDAYAHGEVPFELVVDALGVPRLIGQHPVFGVMLSLQNQGLPSLRLGDASAAPMDGGDQGAKFDLDVTLGEQNDEFVGVLTGAADLFDRSTLEALAGAFAAAVAVLVSDPTTSLAVVADRALPKTLADRRSLRRWGEMFAGVSAAPTLQLPGGPWAPAAHRYLDGAPHRRAANEMLPAAAWVVVLARCFRLEEAFLLGLISADGQPVLPIPVDVRAAPTAEYLISTLTECRKKAERLAGPPLEEILATNGRAPDGTPSLRIEFAFALHPAAVPPPGCAAMLTVCEDGRLRLAHDPAKLSGSQARTLLACTDHVLETLRADAAAPLVTLTLTTLHEREALIAASSGPYFALPSERLTLPELFETQVAIRPDATALVFGTEAFSYAELDASANQLARYCLSLGIGPEVTVAILCDRSPDMIVAMLGVLKAGGAYVPLDPDYPVDRARFVIEDAAASVLITIWSRRDALIAALDGKASLPATLCLDDPSIRSRLRRLSTLPVSDAERTAPLSPDNLAYVIYTSGSTGTPKGTAVPHQNVTRLLARTQARFAIDERDSWSLFHSIAFDFSVWEIWGALAFGGKLVIVPEETRRSTADFLRLLRQQRVTILNQTPSAFDVLAGEESLEPGPVAASSLRLVIFGGEALQPSRLVGWWARHPVNAPQLVNMYGITETTVHVTQRRLFPDDTTSPNSPIGGPIADLAVYILDAALEPVPTGVVGEIYVSGAGLARGYLRRPGLTAERFIACPFGPPGGRMYRTGDLARRRSDGDIVFLGRTDDQVKIRGFRVELGEIEAVLRTSFGASLAQVAVIAAPAAEDCRLVAYLVPKPGTSVPDAATLRAGLGAVLPQYMLPSAFVALEALPLTTNGKLDRRALPASGFRDGARVANRPLTPDEGRMLALWRQVLDDVPADPTADFFDLGGNSLLMARVTTLIAREFGRTVPLASLYGGPTLATFARLAVEAGARTEAPAVRLNQTSRHEPVLFLFHDVSGRVLSLLPLARALEGRVSVVALQTAGPQAPHSAGIVGIVSDLVKALREAQPDGPYHLGGHSLGGLLAFEAARQLLGARLPVASLSILDGVGPAALAALEADESPVAQLLTVARVLAGFFDLDVDLHAPELAPLDPDARLDVLLERLRRAGLPRDLAEGDQARSMLRVYAHLQHEAPLYRAAAIPVPIELYVSQQNDAAALAAGWHDFVSAVRVHGVTGDHVGMLKPPAVSELAMVLAASMDAARS